MKSEHLADSEEKLADSQLWIGALGAFDSWLQTDHDGADEFVLAEHGHLDVRGVVEESGGRTSSRRRLWSGKQDPSIR